MRGLNLCESNKAMNSTHAGANGPDVCAASALFSLLDWKRVVIFDSNLCSGFLTDWDQETKDRKPRNLQKPAIKAGSRSLDLRVKS